MLINFGLILLCYTATVVKAGLICLQNTNASIPANLTTASDVAEFANAGIICIRNQAFLDMDEVFQQSSADIARVYDRDLQSGNVTDLRADVNSIEIVGLRKAHQLGIKCIQQKDRLINNAAERLLALAQGTANEIRIAEQVQKIKDVARTAFNTIFVILSTSLLGYLSITSLTAIDVARIVECTNCENSTESITATRTKYRNLRSTAGLTTTLGIVDAVIPLNMELGKLE